MRLVQALKLLGIASVVGSLSIVGCGGSDEATPGSGSGGGDTDGGDGGGAGGAAGSDAGGVCGNAIVEEGEDCDDGNTEGGDGCENGCTFTCTRDSQCDDGNACSGTETCDTSTHNCTAGTPLGDGDSCGTDMVCQGGACIPASCGNGLVDGSAEECDDGNVTPGDGCENDCTYSCLSTDTARDCTPADECAGSSTCDDSTHTCSTPTPLADDTTCTDASGNTGYCSSGTCTVAQCGNQQTEPGEDCDDGNTDDTDGCKQDCTFTCSANTDCDDGNSCTTNTCDTDHTCSYPADTGQDGQSCTDGSVTGTCSNGSCVPAGCGNGVVDTGEDCDFGTGNMGGTTGCTTNCQFQCDPNDTAACPDTNPCDGADACTSTTQGGYSCQAGAAMNEGDECQASPRRICNASQQCVLSVCGDQYVDSTLGEDCDDGNTDNTDGCTDQCAFSCATNADCGDTDPCDGTTSCAAGGNGQTCQSDNNPLNPGDSCGNNQICSSSLVCGAITCGDGIVSAGEDCDDQNTDDTDGCKADCTFTCTQNSDCSDGRVCTQDVCDTTAHTCSNPADTTQNGNACTPAGGGTGTCNNGVCQAATCGDGSVDAGEDCDDGADGDPNDGCQDDCSFSCATNTDCTDNNACTGTETCAAGGAGQICSPGTPLSPGDPCGTGRICNNSLVCVTVSCGDGFVTAGEECDNGTGNNGAGTGCTTSCQFECDTSADCTDTNTCDGTNVCTTVTGGKLCQSDGNTLNPGDPCGTGRICDNSLACVTATCGDGFVTGSEECDLAGQNGVAGSGCDANCNYQCDPSAGCDDGNACNGSETCDATTGGYTCNAGTNASQGTSCGSGLICDGSGSCVSSICGDGYVDSGGGEQCDNGTGNNGPGTGCTTGCQYECATAGDCDDANLCNGSETCDAVAGGFTCNAGTNASLGTSCGSGLICNGTGSCVTSICGDGYLDTGAGEQCEPPNTATCDASCQNVVAAACGNGVIETGEQCDDGNTDVLDGCDSACMYETWMRMNSVSLEGDTAPSWCTHPDNQIGDAITDTALGQLNPPLNDGITAGTTNIMVNATGLDDLTATSDNSFQIGVASATRPDPADPTAYANSLLDNWFLLDATTVDANGMPNGVMDASVASKALQAGPNQVTVTLDLGGAPATLVMNNARARGTFSGTSVPGNGLPVNGLAAGLTVAERLDASASSQGLCGDITVESLAAIPLPESVASNCASSCGASYTGCADGESPLTTNCNSLLDVLVSGCRARVFICITAISPQPPDVAGSDGDIDALTPGSGYKIPTSQTNGNDDAYSAWLTFQAYRVHATGVE